jgi:hypothetical protein
MKRIILFFICYSLFSQPVFSESLIAKKAAKVDNEIILVKDVEKNAKNYNLKYEDSLRMLLDDAVLYYGAKVYADEPKDNEIENQINSDKLFYAKKLGKKVSELSDEEFSAVLLDQGISMKSYREYVKKTLWISKYLNDEYAKEKTKEYLPSDKDINNLINTKPELFEEKDGVVLSMIYFSAYKSNGELKSKDEIKNLKTKAEACLTEINKGSDFEELVSKYSDDMVSAKSVPKGHVGIIYFDDPRVVRSFNDNILTELKKAESGVLKKVLESGNGLYIFNIEERIKAMKLSKEEAKLKAESFLLKDYNTNMKNKLREKMINDLKKNVDITIYK